ncbi:MAG: oligosaccharide repeat unit polymerase [Myxococcales bacterium]|nr:oligosaccharide repeat unit polymerase [Myxococcales bacterium]
MSEDATTLAALVVAVLLFVACLRRCGLADPLVAIMAFYLFFAFGPVLNHLLGAPIYFGTKIHYIPQAAGIFTLGMLGLGLPAWFIPLRRQAFQADARRPSPLAPILRPAHLVMGLVSAALVLRALAAGTADKVAIIGAVGPSLHYPYLLIELYLTAFYFHTGRGAPDRLAWRFNTAAYLTYCVLTGERDFIFTMVGVMIVHALLRPREARAWPLVLGGLLLGALGTAMFFLRDANQEFSSPWVALLNQGSLLFVNTFTLFLLDGQVGHFWGETYLLALANLIPGVGVSFNLPDWLRDQYAYASSSGYGYGLDAEGYLNFGWLGVFATFLAIGLLQRRTFNMRRARDFVIYYAVFLSGFTMYCLRNDSIALFKGHLYAVVAYAALRWLAQFLPREPRSAPRS